MSFDGHNGLSTIQFTAVIGSDGVIHPPSGVELPNGKVEVSVRVTPLAELGDRSTESADRRPRPAPGLFKGVITYMAPDFDAPLEDMKEYME